MPWSPPKAMKGRVLGLVGKAATFDTGGISIKAAGGMEDMKAGMTKLGLPVETIAVIPAAENMPDGRAIQAELHSAFLVSMTSVLPSTGRGETPIGSAGDRCRESP